ncbi:hypothetical protein BDN70DRAFT_918979 [Pholiota conissans]|uniref:Uncharacterized protein n=1 Tax=Pholiota conissans TaxID=109636 RepID=A0A9P5ZAW5_9AGAR|nr:hypothetical protein BDN70DRAFT_918979 [Pholiota conissans]
MPKASSQTSSSQQSSNAGSPAKKGFPRNKKVTEVQDKSLWRPSWIPETATITKTDAMKRYHLNKKDMDGLNYTTTTANSFVKITERFYKAVESHVYKERDVEMRAWEKHGGPEGFQRMLNKRAKGGKKSNNKPKSYEVGVDPAPVPLPAALVPDIDIETPNIILGDIKANMQDRNELWLWDAVNKVLHEMRIPDTSPDGRDRTTLMMCADNTLQGHYPQRPASAYSLPPNSASVEALNKLLSRAPSTQDGPAIDSQYDDAAKNMVVEWKKAYKDKVFAKLSGVLQEHGSYGLETARWIVYDKYVKCGMSSLDYQPNPKWPAESPSQWIWNDSAKFWLENALKRE